jgi:uncharacterized protein
MSKSILQAACVLALGAGTALAQPRPSFDCAKAQGEVETAICGSADLSNLDRDIAASYAAARGQLDAGGRKALQDDQAQFLATREIALTWPDASLKDHMASRLAFLRSVRTAPAGADAAAFLGAWKADGGAVTIARAAGGKLKVTISTFAPVTARWVCEVEADASIVNGRIGFVEDDVRITLRRTGSVLKIDERLPDARRGRDYCGANGSIAGAFFRTK